MNFPVESVGAPAASSHEQLGRRARLLEILDNGLPPFQQTALELTKILNDPSANVRDAAKPIRADPGLSSQVLRLCNSALFGRRRQVLSLEQAAAMLGTERLRSMAMTSSLAGFAGKGLPKDQVETFWKHSFFAAMLSKHLAGYIDYPEKEQAYIAGLLHDVGQVPHWMLAAEEKARRQAGPPEGWLDNPSVERAYFGMGHCEAGGRMASSWNLMPSFVDVLASHHDANEAQHDRFLVRIVAAVEHFLLEKEESAARSAAAPPSAEASPANAISARSCQPFSDADWPDVEAALEQEYTRLLPLVEGGLTGMLRSL